MRFHYAPSITTAFPSRITGAVFLDRVTASAQADSALAPFLDRAATRLKRSQEGAMPEVQAWRRAFSAMGLRPTQYRCAAEALLRRFRKDGALPRIHPLVDLCNAVSLAYAIPVAVYDCDRIVGDLLVCAARGSETYQTFGGGLETPEPGEVIFLDDAGHAHARRWCNRQSLRSALSEQTSRALIVAEALHDGAGDDIAALLADLGTALERVFDTTVDAEVLAGPKAAFLVRRTAD